MAKLCYKVGGTVKKYDLKDSANKPRLAVKSNGVTKYLGLQQGTKSGELNVKLNGQTLYVKTWGIDAATSWRGMAPEEPYKGLIQRGIGDSDYGGVGLWVLVNEENYPVVVFGRLGADKPDDWARAIWYPNVEGTDSVTKFPLNFKLTAEQVTHPKRLKPNIRLATISSSAVASKDQANNTFTVSNGDWYAYKNNVCINDIYTRLTVKSGNYVGYVRTNGKSPWFTTYGYGINTINTRGVYWPTGNEEKMGGSYSVSYYNTGIDSEGFKVTSYSVTLEPFGNNGPKYYNTPNTYAIYTGLTSDSSPYVVMYGVSDGKGGGLGNWAQRDIYIEFPYAWGEDTNPNDHFTFSPKQVLDAVKAIAEEKGIADYAYGFTRGRNY